MSSTRYFSGGRDKGSYRSTASEIMRIEIQKKGKMPTADRYRHILKERFKESKEKVLRAKGAGGGFKLPGSFGQARKMSARAEAALKQIAMKKAAKEAKALRRMVIVTPRKYQVGLLNQKGKIYDVAGNLVAQINLKNGNMSSMGGWGFGKYKPKNHLTHVVIQDAITKYSPYYIQQRKRLQQGGGPVTNVWGAPDQDVINLYGYDTPDAANVYGPAPSKAVSFGNMGPRQNIGVTAWGARSDNIWGAFADNAWGNSADNVWGGVSSNIWGGIGERGDGWGTGGGGWAGGSGIWGGGSARSLWGAKSINVYGTGDGRNRLTKLTAAVLGMLGFKTGKARQLLSAQRQARLSGAARNSGRVGRS